MNTRALSTLVAIVLVASASGQYAAWPATSYSPFLQALLAPLQHPVVPLHGGRYFATAPLAAPVVPGLFAANMVPRVIPHGPPRVVSYNPALRIYG